jgi:hypothetical protein
VPQQTADPAHTCLLHDNQHSGLQPGTECKHTVAVTQCTGTTYCDSLTHGDTQFRSRPKITDLIASEAFKTVPQVCDVMTKPLQGLFLYFAMPYQTLSLCLSSEIW